MATVTCPRCGRDNPEGARFCLECGNALASAVAPREERKVVTVLFADLVGFTERSDRADPEEVRAVLAPYHAMLRTLLEKYGGTVEKFIGDAVMALFGAPMAHEDDPERAVRAALAIRDDLMAEGRLRVRVGVTTGEALVTLDARPEAGEGMASGDVVNTASRLQSAAPSDGILVDEATYRATSRIIEFRDHEPVVAKGKSEPVLVHEAVAARPRFGVDVRQSGTVPLVGREGDLQALDDALRRALDGRQPQLVTIVGVPGIGKSRLLWELFVRVEASDQIVAWRQGRSLPYAESISYWALGEIVKAEAAILETDAPDDAASKLALAVQAVIETDSDADWIERHLAPLVGLKTTTEVRGDHRGEAFAAWRRYLEALAEKRPLVLVFEDLHWADDGLLDFIESLFDWAADVPLLILGTARTELLKRRPGWGGGRPNARIVSLSPLSEVETRSLVAGLIEQSVMPASVRDAVLAAAQGNPLYAEEFARLLAAGGRIDELPNTVQGIIAARLDGLGSRKELLQGAAVMGKVFWSGAVAAMFGSDRFEVEERLRDLERAEFVRRERRSSVAGESEYSFRHILIRDVAYGQIPRGPRAERHVAAAAWIESLGRSEDHAELLAQHYLAAIELDVAAGRSTDAYSERARRALFESGDHALALNAFGPAARYYRSALDLTSPDDNQRPLLLFKYGKALQVSQQAGDEVLAEAEKALLDAGDVGTAAEAIVLQAELAWFRGDGEQTSSHLRRAAELVTVLPDSYSKAFVLSDLSRYQALRGESAAAIERGEQALALASRLGLEEVRAHALTNVGLGRFSLGDESAIADLEQAIEITARINSPQQARAMVNLGHVLMSRGETKRGRELNREGVAVARAFGDRAIETFSAANIPRFDYSEGAWDDALTACNSLLAEAEAAGGRSHEAMIRVFRAQIRFARGELDAALDDLDPAIVQARRIGEAQFVADPHGFGAWLFFHLGRTADAEQLVAELAVLPGLRDFLTIEGALAMVAAGRASVLAQLASIQGAGLWPEVFSAVAAGDLRQALDRLDPHDYAAQSALLRFEIARDLAEQGQRQAAANILGPAVEFWRSVGAAYFLARAKDLVAAPASATARPAG